MASTSPAPRPSARLAAGVIDELTLDLAPVLLGSGERLYEAVGAALSAIDAAVQIEEPVAVD